MPKLPGRMQKMGKLVVRASLLLVCALVLSVLVIPPVLVFAEAGEAIDAQSTWTLVGVAYSTLMMGIALRWKLHGWHRPCRGVDESS